MEFEFPADEMTIELAMRFHNHLGIESPISGDMTTKAMADMPYHIQAD